MGSPAPAASELVLFTREGCSLCPEAREAIELVLDERRRSGRPVPTFREVNIAGDDELEPVYAERIPVVEIGGERLELVIGARRLARLMERILDGVTAA
jgi:glutaredoxin